MTAVTITLTFATINEAIDVVSRLGVDVKGNSTAAITPAEASLKNPPATPGTGGGKPEESPKADAAATSAASQPSAGTAKTDAPAGDAVDYASLSKSVLALMKLDATAPGPIAQSLGFPTFKAMKESENGATLFAKAKAAVDAKIAELEAV